jgi:hypothetical protein
MFVKFCPVSEFFPIILRQKDVSIQKNLYHETSLQYIEINYVLTMVRGRNAGKVRVCSDE